MAGTAWTTNWATRRCRGRAIVRADPAAAEGREPVGRRAGPGVIRGDADHAGSSPATAPVSACRRAGCRPASTGRSCRTGRRRPGPARCRADHRQCRPAAAPAAFPGQAPG
ncbi:hypothetical protein G6F22_020943 [Rhizopus arrhizus]|nr:hypothetical protein G6F22_020943 [Rhizopus arrhizus]